VLLGVQAAMMSKALEMKRNYDQKSSKDKDADGNSRYKCRFCQYVSPVRCNVKRHERVHTGEKPFRCLYCDFRCSQNCDLKKHIRTHTGEKPFTCELCSYRSSRKEQLKMHMLTQH
ncbi:hypothetical protein SK128_001315, partial [Halocaridina rubra]